MAWPQIIVLSIYLLETALAWILHGDRVTKSFPLTVANLALMISLLMWGGFFGSACQ